VSVLKKAKVAAVSHKHIDLFIDLIGNGSGKRDERQAADKVLNLTETGILMYLVCFACIPLDQSEIRVVETKRRVKFRVEFQAEIRVAIGQDRRDELGYSAGADAKLKNDVIAIGRNAVHHRLRQLGGAWRDSPDLSGVLEKRPQELNILVHLNYPAGTVSSVLLTAELSEVTREIL